MTTITATYSPEDNKIRLYASTRLDAETFAKVKAAGFKWAPRQELFEAPMWTPEREDLARELAGDIEQEEMTLAERAQAKAERLDALAEKRHRQALEYAARADLSEEATGIPFGQPILVGHHSERRHRKVIDRANRAMSQAVKSAKAADYWQYRAEGVERFANMKNDPRTRANRIKTLLAELRDLQRGINDAHAALALWEKITTDDQIRWALGNMDSRRLLAGYGTYSAVHSGEITPAEARARCIAAAELRINGPKRKRWIAHVLGRLSFERHMLGDVPRYEGELTPVILQAFAREQGAEKPVCTVTDPGSFEIESPVPLPAHIHDGKSLDMTADDWRDLMQDCGYTVPDPKPRRVSNKPAPASLVNPTAEQAEQLQRIWNLQMRASCKAAGHAERAEENTVKAVSQALYSANSGGSYSPFETVEIDAQGRRIHSAGGGYSARWDDEPCNPVARIRIYSRGAGFNMPRAVVHITDKPAKALPLDLDAIERAAVQAIADAGEPATLGGAPYDPALLKIRRRRQSTSQAEVELYYNGRKLARHGDMIQRNDSGGYDVRPDSYWHEIAARDLALAAERAAA